MLGSGSEADDAVQEAWLRLSRSVLARSRTWRMVDDGSLAVCLDMLRSPRLRRREEPLDLDASGPIPTVAGTSRETGATPSARRSWPIRSGLRCSWYWRCSRRPIPRRVRAARPVRPPFEEIAPIVGAQPRGTAARQPGTSPSAGARPSRDADRTRQRQVVDAFLAAREAVISMRCSRYWTQRSCFGGSGRGADRRASEVRGATDVAKTSLVASGRKNRRWWEMDWRDWYGRRSGDAGVFGSPLRTERLSPSIWSPTQTGSASSTCGPRRLEEG